MLELTIICAICTFLLPVVVAVMPIMMDNQGWPELPPEEEHYISSPRVIFAAPVHEMFTQEGNTENVCLCHQCYTVMMLTIKIKEEHEKKRRTPPPLPIATTILRLPMSKPKQSPNYNPDPFGFDFSDIEVNNHVTQRTSAHPPGSRRKTVLQGREALHSLLL
jgi:hypothetical protein